jgi:hypothetical protein
MSGRIAKAPCGHDGEHVIGQFVRCLTGCDDVVEKCVRCGSTRLELFSAALVPEGSKHCVDCGKVRWAP